MKKEVKIQIGAEGIKAAFVYLIITVIYTLLVMNVDKAPIGPNDTVVGFSKINGKMAGIFGYNSLFDKITDVAMLIAILVAAGFAVLGLIQLVKGKSLFKVDKKIYGLALVYVVVMVLYVFFDKVPLNYRPVLVPGETELEASFPSTHTMVICTILSTAVLFWRKVFEGEGKYVKDVSVKNLDEKKGAASSVFISGDRAKLRKGLETCARFIMFVAVIGRILAGVHWITDILGGLLISATITEFYSALFIGKTEEAD
ncbi:MULTISPECIES: phosphatase PAP2 family protein [unclassified Butyrivibrio]|uniref:phosphatase PAP2 family protein n=1 Tax=unclassified Butyrivibrio TaxID=2639466 RepID=UPI0018C9D27D|nr:MULTISPECIES: phosphatase PAP2 family protein [unclassified Butyrivibrio]MDC7292875.1 phosphatase PAP2 family protein [Butyrivibrio sp. DSM 10294]